jgi:hypothetical protein
MFKTWWSTRKSQVSYEGGVFITTDGAATWNEANTGLTNNNVFSLAIDPVTPSTLYAGTTHGGVFISTNNGTEWSLSNTGLPDTPIRDFAFNPLNTQAIYTATSKGVFKSLNGGGTWSVYGLDNMPIVAISIDPLKPTTFYAGTVSNGVFRTEQLQRIYLPLVLR